VRILLVGPTHPFRGGIAHHTTLLAGALRSRADLTFVSFRRLYIQALFPGASDKDHSDTPIAIDGVRRELDTLAPWTFLRVGREARNYDAVVLPWWVAFWAPFYLLLLAALAGKSRVIFVCHNVSEHEPHALKDLATKTVLARGDAFVVPSSDEAAKLHRLIGERPTVVTPHPSYDVFDNQRYDRKAARDSLGIRDDDEVVLFFGFIRPYKGLDVLVRAMQPLLAKRPRALLLVVGECWEDADAYRRAAESLGARCRLVMEYVPNEDVERYFKASDVVALPYQSGSGSGIAQIALGMGIPVVATQIGAFDEVIVDGETGLLVPPGDAAALADALATALEPATRTRMSSAIANDRARFSWDALADKIIALVAAELPHGR
jgi:glycosyltransferase involved in cell wall biosynthesis